MFLIANLDMSLEVPVWIYAPVVGIFGSCVIEVLFAVVIQSVSSVVPAFEMGKQSGCHSLTPSLVLLLRSSLSYETEHILSRRRRW